MRAISTFLLLAFVASASAVDTTKDDLAKLEKQLRAAHENVGPAIVCVVVSRSDQYPKPPKAAEPWQLGGFDRAAFLKAEPTKTKLADQLDLSKTETIPDHGFAGGLVLDAEGHVLTNASTIEGAAKIYVHLPGGKGSYADVRASDRRSDLAVLTLLNPPADLKPIRFGRVRLPHSADDAKATIFPGKVGVIMAYPYASAAVMDRPKAGLATVSSIRVPEGRKDSTVFSSVYNYAPVLEYEAKLNAGASGALLLNLDGEAIALTAATAGIPGGDSGIGYALPLDENVARIIEVLRRGEEVEYGFLGVTRPQFPQPRRGIPVEGTPTRGSPAELARLFPGDLITRINDHPVGTFEDLLLHVGSGLAGKTITMRAERPSQPPRDIEVKLAKFKNEEPFIASVRPEPVFGLRVDYSSVLVQTLVFNPFGGRNNLAEIPPGVLASELAPDSPAALKFKALGESNRWIVTHVNGKPTLSPPDFYKAAQGQKTVKLSVYDPTENMGRTREVTLP